MARPEVITRNQTILVVDDERYIVDLLADLLEEEGYGVQRAYDGAAALEIVERNEPDLILADVMMPYLDGLALVGKLRERAMTTPIVLMSAAVTPRYADVTFVPKPFDIDHVLYVIARELPER
jgi:DNA-binding response OmpR family regulator